MKPFLISCAALACAFSLAACDNSKKSAASEKDAIASLKAKFKEIGEFVKSGGPQDAANPATEVLRMKQLMDKMSGLPTEGLPADLATAIGKMNSSVGGMLEIINPLLEGVPTDEAGMKKFGEELAADPEKMKAFKARKDAMGEKMKAAVASSDVIYQEAKPILTKYEIEPPK